SFTDHDAYTGPPPFGVTTTAAAASGVNVARSSALVVPAATVIDVPTVADPKGPGKIVTVTWASAASAPEAGADKISLVCACDATQAPDTAVGPDSAGTAAVKAKSEAPPELSGNA